MMKTCTKCGKTSGPEGFYARKNRPAALSSWCRKCVNKHNTVNSKRAYRENPEAYKAVQRKSIEKLRAATFAAYGGAHCACCGENEKAFLTLDHTTSKFKPRNSSGYRIGGPAFYRKLAKAGFPDGYQVLCMNCNWGKYASKGICPHRGTSNDHPHVGVGSSEPKRLAPAVPGDDMVCSAVQTAAVDAKLILH